jgi:hypothetical protein
VKTLTGDGAKPAPPDCVMGRHKDSDRRGKQIFKISSPVANFPMKVVSVGELRPIVRLVVVIAVEHDFKSSRCHLFAQILNERSILVQGMNRPAAAQLLRNGLAGPSSAKWHDCERHRPELSDVTVGALELLGLREEVRVIVTNAKTQSMGLYSAVLSHPS